MYLSKLAKIIEDKALVEKYNSRLPVLKNRIQAYFYDSVSGYFYDKSTTDQSFIKVIGPEAWIVLWAKIATKEQAKQIIDKIMDPAHFNTYLPFPTLSASHPQFNPQNGYWRGPVWIDQAWFALEGMKNYGYDEQYHEMLNKLLNNADGLLAIDQSIRENYDPINGQGLNATHFSWSAVHLLLLLQGEL